MDGEQGYNPLVYMALLVLAIAALGTVRRIVQEIVSLR